MNSETRKSSLFFPFLILSAFMMFFYIDFFGQFKVYEDIVKKLDTYYKEHDLTKEEVIEDIVLLNTDNSYAIYVFDKNSTNEKVLLYKEGKNIKDITEDIEKIKADLLSDIDNKSIKRVFLSNKHLLDNKLFNEYEDSVITNYLKQFNLSNNYHTQLAIVDFLHENKESKDLITNRLIVKINNKYLLNTPNDYDTINKYFNKLKLENKTSLEATAFFTYDKKEYLVYNNFSKDKKTKSQQSYAVFENGKVIKKPSKLDDEMLKTIEKYVK